MKNLFIWKQSWLAAHLQGMGSGHDIQFDWRERRASRCIAKKNRKILKKECGYELDRGKDQLYINWMKNELRGDATCQVCNFAHLSKTQVGICLCNHVSQLPIAPQIFSAVSAPPWQARPSQFQILHMPIMPSLRRLSLTSICIFHGDLGPSSLVLMEVC